DGSGSPRKQPVPAALLSRQNPQNTLVWPLRAAAVRWMAVVNRLKAIGSPPMLLRVGGGQSCEVGKPAFTALSAGAQARPSFPPPWQVFPRAQVPAPQSAFTAHVMPSCAPSPTQA